MNTAQATLVTDPLANPLRIGESSESRKVAESINQIEILKRTQQYLNSTLSKTVTKNDSNRILTTVGYMEQGFANAYGLDTFVGLIRLDDSNSFDYLGVNSINFDITAIYTGGQVANFGISDFNADIYLTFYIMENFSSSYSKLMSIKFATFNYDNTALTVTINGLFKNKRISLDSYINERFDVGGFLDFNNNPDKITKAQYESIINNGIDIIYGVVINGDGVDPLNLPVFDPPSFYSFNVGTGATYNGYIREAPSALI